MDSDLILDAVYIVLLVLRGVQNMIRMLCC